jgi:hypothetical protein
MGNRFRYRGNTRAKRPRPTPAEVLAGAHRVARGFAARVANYAMKPPWID